MSSEPPAEPSPPPIPPEALTAPDPSAEPVSVRPPDLDRVTSLRSDDPLQGWDAPGRGVATTPDAPPPWWVRPPVVAGAGAVVGAALAPARWRVLGGGVGALVGAGVGLVLPERLR